jgi:hypothetical protein
MSQSIIGAEVCIPWAEMCLGPKYAWVQSECGSKVI